MFNAEIEAARESFPRLVEEFERLRLWVFTCLGEHVAMPGGPAVDAPASEHSHAAAELAHQKGDTAAAEAHRRTATELAKAEAQA